jgi:hypothetical protein
VTTEYRVALRVYPDRMKAIVLLIAFVAGCAAESEREPPYGLFEIQRVEYGRHAGAELQWPRDYQIALSSHDANPIGADISGGGLVYGDAYRLMIDVSERWTSPTIGDLSVAVHYDLAVLDDENLSGIANAIVHWPGLPTIDVGFNVTAVRVAP